MPAHDVTVDGLSASGELQSRAVRPTAKALLLRAGSVAPWARGQESLSHHRAWQSPARRPSGPAGWDPSTTQRDAATQHDDRFRRARGWLRLSRRFSNGSALVL